MDAEEKKRLKELSDLEHKYGDIAEDLEEDGHCCAWDGDGESSTRSASLRHHG